MSKRIITSFATVAVLLGGCSLAPRYERPASPVAERYDTSDATNAATQAAADIGWEQFFSDPRLQAVIRTALENNRDLRVAALNVERVRALYNIQRTALIPSLDATADGSRRRTPGDLSASGQSTISSSYQVGLEIPSYELDFFGRVTSLRDQVLQQYLATEEAQRSAQISLIATVARQYFTVLAANEQLALARQTLDAANRSFELNRKSFEAGVASEIDLRTAEAQRESVRASVAAIEQSRDLAQNALTLLVGAALPAAPVAKPEDAPSEALAKDGLTSSLLTQNLIEDLPAGLPSDLLTRRPDILAAEHTLQAANANIGIARAAFFPSVKLTAFGGTASTELSGLFDSGSKAWSFAPSITLPIFAAGRNKAQLNVANIQKRIEIANYEKAIQTAFREVSDALAVRQSIGTQIDAQAARTAAAQRRYDLSEQRYKAGVDSFLTVLLAQQELFIAQQQLITARLARLNNLTTLYAALGGGVDRTEQTQPAQE